MRVYQAASALVSSVFPSSFGGWETNAGTIKFTLALDAVQVDCRPQKVPLNVASTT